MAAEFECRNCYFFALFDILLYCLSWSFDRLDYFLHQLNNPSIVSCSSSDLCSRPQLHCPSLDRLQHLNVFLAVNGPKLNTRLEVQPHQCRVERDDHCPGPAGHTIADKGQDAICLLGHLGSLLAHVQLPVDQHLQVLFCQAAFEPLFPQPEVLPGVVVTQGQDLALGLTEPHTIGLGPSIQPVQIALQNCFNS
ncbi:hypothetical protein WISP_94987 [Willisornis vidua]|uniref:Uncharacterized protein n=1 Tax=Willisornis vidua TaxID=1566151 RepID=A0ABQ9D5M1_9PASS|nr:hypothetical protein WISP_94987 [Willisornis vidua]